MDLSNYKHYYGPFPKYIDGCWAQKNVLTKEYRAISTKDSPFSFASYTFPFCLECNKNLPNTLIYAVFKNKIKNFKTFKTWDHLLDSADIYYIDCRLNFTQEEQDFIESLGINNLNDLLRADIPKSDKKEVVEKYREISTEPGSGRCNENFVFVFFGKDWYVVQLFLDRSVKFIDKI